MRKLTGVEQSLIISRNLRKIRKGLKMTQEQVAELSGIHRVSYCKYETGGRLMHIQHLVMIANALNVTVDELLKGTLEAMQKDEGDSI